MPGGAGYVHVPVQLRAAGFYRGRNFAGSFCFSPAKALFFLWYFAIIKYLYCGVLFPRRGKGGDFRESEIESAATAQFWALLRVPAPVCPAVRPVLPAAGGAGAGHSGLYCPVQPGTGPPPPEGDQQISGQLYRQCGQRHQGHHAQLPAAHGAVPAGERRHHLDQRALPPAQRPAGAAVRLQAVLADPRL